MLLKIAETSIQTSMELNRYRFVSAWLFFFFCQLIFLFLIFLPLPGCCCSGSRPGGSCCRPGGCTGCSPQTRGWKAIADGRQMRQNTNEKWFTNKRKRDKHKQVRGEKGTRLRSLTSRRPHEVNVDERVTSTSNTSAKTKSITSFYIHVLNCNIHTH